MGDTLAFLPYGNEFRTQRRMTQQYFTKAKIVDHRPIQTREARILVNGLRSQPDSREELLVRSESFNGIDFPRKTDTPL